jgi:hypothetical protein
MVGLSRISFPLPFLLPHPLPLITLIFTAKRPPSNSASHLGKRSQICQRGLGRSSSHKWILHMLGTNNELWQYCYLDVNDSTQIIGNNMKLWKYLTILLQFYILPLNFIVTKLSVATVFDVLSSARTFPKSGGRLNLDIINFYIVFN